MAKYTHFIPQNVAEASARKIAVFNPKGKQVGIIALGGLKMPRSGEKLYSFGALSDVHIVYDTAAEDFQKALNYLNEDVDVAFTCVCGDLTDDGTPQQLAQYKAVVDSHSPDTPVYAVSGNHEAWAGEVTDETISPYTGQPLYYSFSHGDDVFIMVGYAKLNNEDLFAEGELQWLYGVLEAYRGKRCFVFFHVFPWGDCGNPGELYWTDIFQGTQKTVFQSLLQHYKNTVFFHGHSHTKFSLQEVDDKANYSEAMGYRSIHIPSLSVPRDIQGGDLVNIYAASEGYVVDVYVNGIHLRGRDFVKGEFLPIASYWVNTKLQSVGEKTYVDETGTIREEEIITNKDVLVRDVTANLTENWNLTPNSSNGQLNTNYFTFKEIPIEPGAKYYAKYGTRSWFYDSEKQPIKTLNLTTKSGTGSDVQYEFVTPSKAYYIGISYSYSSAGSADNVYIRKVV